ncbi:hypothetical protein Y032_0092g2549 [Ancylostoma ceylanicum]|uniref:SCP domain-containing protein n=1 Tax=Ancylostoma ceylanicum TaxID=53326 RepID=A0A016TLU7_9BILA|nr:hypothetical protein Y032_0092g2549 [Ancylostoma ceylanicum]
MSGTAFCIILLAIASVYCEICPENAEQTDELRQRILDLHNNLRSRLAKGLEKNVLLYNESSLQASAMRKLMYDCAAEQAAYEVAKKCLNVRTPCGKLNGYGENMARVMGDDVTPVLAAEKAISKWWGEFASHGHHWNNMYTKELLQSGNLEHYVQMAWSRTTHIGCAVQNCASSTIVVCRYRPTGRRLNDVIYEVGDTCSACPHGTSCEQETGLCI